MTNTVEDINGETLLYHGMQGIMALLLSKQKNR
jgi:hypothetical protein